MPSLPMDYPSKRSANWTPARSGLFPVIYARHPRQLWVRPAGFDALVGDYTLLEMRAARLCARHSRNLDEPALNFDSALGEVG
jgi:hypothetical protein